MRGRRGGRSSSAAHERLPVAQSEQVMAGVSGERPQKHAAEQDEENEISFSLPSSRLKRRRLRGNKARMTEMTEEEMMDLALGLSEQEASMTALRLQEEEEEAVRRAIHSSMLSDSQPAETLPADISLGSTSRRKLSYSEWKVASTVDREHSQHSNLNAGAESGTKGKKRKWRARSPLLERADVAQTSPRSCEGFSAAPDSPQTSDSTQIEDLDLQRSPVFPSTSSRAAVQVVRLDQDLLQTCRSSGFVMYSQDTWTSTQRSVRPESSMDLERNLTPPPKSPVFSGGRGPTGPGPDYMRNSVFGRNTWQGGSQVPEGHQAPETRRFMSSSQESLSLSVRSNSPVFPGSPAPSSCPRPPPSGGLTSPRSLDRDQMEPSSGPTHRNAATHSNGAGRPSGGHETDACDAASTKTSATCDMTLMWTDVEDDVTLSGSPSPVFPEEMPAIRVKVPRTSLNHQNAGSPGEPGPTCSTTTQRQVSNRCTSHRTASSEERSLPVRSRGDESDAPPATQEAASERTVHYYWGVPFCPRGLDPDTYTQVIVTQLEVYEKSLKDAQRRLLTKVEWGEPILPRPEKSPPTDAGSPPRVHRRLKARGRRRRKQEEEEEEGEMEERPETQNEDEEKDGEEDLTETDCEICPETQLCDENTKGQTNSEDADEPPIRTPELQIFLGDDSPTGDDHKQQVEEKEEEQAEVQQQQHQEEEEGEVLVGGPTWEPVVRGDEEVKEDSGGSDVEELKGRGPLRAPSPEPDPGPPTSVDCPMCQRPFPPYQIERHAAFCDGEPASPLHVTVSSRRTRGAELPAQAKDSGLPGVGRLQQEKCYICQRGVDLREYSRHTEECIQRQRGRARGNLLSALQRTESRDSDAGPSGVKWHSGDVIDLLDDEDEEQVNEALPGFRISDSPIKSFTPISEATDCLVDFRGQQRAKKPGRRRR